MFVQKSSKPKASVQQPSVADSAGQAQQSAINEQLHASPAMVAQRKVAENVNGSQRMSAQRKEMQVIANRVSQLAEDGSSVQARATTSDVSTRGAGAGTIQAKAVGAASLQQMQSLFGDSLFKKIVKLAHEYEALPIPEDLVDVDVEDEFVDVESTASDEPIVLDDKFYDQVWSKAIDIRLAIADWDQDTYDDRKSSDRIQRRQVLDLLEDRVTTAFQKKYVKKSVNEERQKQKAADKVAADAKRDAEIEKKKKVDAALILRKKADELAAKAAELRQQATKRAQERETAAIGSAEKDGINDFLSARKAKQSLVQKTVTKDKEGTPNRWVKYGDAAASESIHERTNLIEHRVAFWEVQWDKVKGTVEGQDRTAWISAQIETDGELKRQLEVQETQAKIKLDYHSKWKSKLIGGGEEDDYVKAKLAKDPKRIQDDMSLIAAESRSTLFLSTLADKVATIKKQGNSAELRKAVQTKCEIFNIENPDWSNRVGNGTYFGAEFERAKEDVGEEKKAATAADIERLKKLKGQRDQIGRLLKSVGSILAPDGQIISVPCDQRAIFMVSEQFLPQKVRELYIHDAKEELRIAAQHNGEKFAEWLRETNGGRNTSTETDRHKLGAMDKLEIGSMIHSAITGFLK